MATPKASPFFMPTQQKTFAHYRLFHNFAQETDGKVR